MKEPIILKHSPSQITNLLKYLAAFLVFAIVSYLLAWINVSYLVWFTEILIYAGYNFWIYIQLKNLVITVTRRRILIKRGLLSIVEDQAELFRVIDFQLETPFVMGRFGLSNIRLITNDETDQYILIPAISDGKKYLELIRECVIESKKEANIVEWQSGRKM